MPGFGDGPFGRQPFGEWKWSRRVLYETMPEIYRSQDQAAGGLLEEFSEGLRPSFDNLRRKIRQLGDTLDPLNVRTQYDEVQTIKLGPVLGQKGVVEQRGVGGSVDGLQQFNAQTARFRPYDIGKELFISNSQFPENNRRVTITSLVNGTTVVTDPYLVTDGSPLVWELRTKVTPPDTHVTIELRGGYDATKITPSWIVFDGTSEFTTLARRMFSVGASEKKLLVEQEGADGAIDNQGKFRSITISLTQRDVGKKLSLTSSIIENNGRFEITKVYDDGIDVYAELDADPILAQDSGLTWVLLPYPQIDIAGTVLPLGVVEQEGLDLEITASGADVTVRSNTANFTAGDVGKLLSVRGSLDVPSNDATYEVTAVVSQSVLTLVQKTPDPASLESDLCWELRSPTTLDNDSGFVKAEIRAPSMLTKFAPNFGIEVDTQESEKRQRSWVKNISTWLDRKGLADAYQAIGGISGFDVTVSPLYHIAASLMLLIPSGNLVTYQPVPGSGRTGTNGTLAQAGARYRLSDPFAAFIPDDVGETVVISNSSNVENNKAFEIESVISPTEVEFNIAYDALLPDASNGTLHWTVVRLYTTLPPTLPVYDEVNSDKMTEIVTGLNATFGFFSADRYCWEDTFRSDVPIVPTTSTQISPGLWRIGVIGGYLNPRPVATDTPFYAATPEVILSVGNWFFTPLRTSLASGTNGTVSGTAPDGTFVDPAGLFTASHIGKYIRLTNPDSTDAGVFRIVDVLDANTLTYFNGLISVPGASSVTWEIFEGPVTYAVETVPAKEAESVVIQSDLGSFTPGGSATFTRVGNQVTMTDPAKSFSSVKSPGHHVQFKGATSPGNNGTFVIISATGTTLVYENPNGVTETYPGSGSFVIGRAVYYFNVASAANPIDAGSNEPGYLEYRCPFVSSCDYCAASKVYITIEATAELLSEGAVQIERLLERVLIRMEEVTPAHVELIINFIDE